MLLTLPNVGVVYIVNSQTSIEIIREQPQAEGEETKEEEEGPSKVTSEVDEPVCERVGGCG